MNRISKLFLGNEKNLTGMTFTWTVASGIVYALSSLIFLVVVTNFMGDSAAGVYSIGMVIAQQMLTLGKFSVRNYQVSDVKNKYTFEDYLTFRLITCLFMMLITVGWAFFGEYSTEEIIVILCMTIYKMAECISDVFEGLYQQKFRFDVSGKSQFIKNMITILVFVVGIVVTQNLVFSSVVLAITSLLIIGIIDLPLTLNFARLGLRFRFRIMKELVVACFSLFLSSFLYVYINNAPKYSIKALGGERGKIELAHFNALFMPVFAVDLLAGFTMRMWLTKMAVYHADGDRKKFKKIVRRQFGMIALITVVSMVFMYFFGGFFLSLLYGINLYGYDAVNASLMLSGGLVAFYTLYENVIIIYRQQHYSIFINVFSAIFAAIIVPIMTQKSGIEGATMGYLLANAVRALGYFVIAQYYMYQEKKKSVKVTKNL